MTEYLNEDQKKEMSRWHVSSSEANRYMSSRLNACLPVGSTRVYEVMRGEAVKAITFTRCDADDTCRVLARAAADCLRTHIR